MIRWWQLVFRWGRGLNAWHLEEFLLTLLWFPYYVGCRAWKAAPHSSIERKQGSFQLVLFICSLLKLFFFFFFRSTEWVSNLKKKNSGWGESKEGKMQLPNCDLNWDWHQQTFPHQPVAHLVQTKQIEDLFCQWDHLAFLFMLQKEPVPVSHQSTRLLVAGLCCSFWLALIWDF